MLPTNMQLGFIPSPQHSKHPPTSSSPTGSSLQPQLLHPGNVAAWPPWGPGAQGGRCKGARAREAQSYAKTAGLRAWGASLATSVCLPSWALVRLLDPEGFRESRAGVRGIGIGPQLPRGAAVAKLGWGGWVWPAPSSQRKWSLLYIRPPALQSWEKEGWGVVEK